MPVCADSIVDLFNAGETITALFHRQRGFHWKEIMNIGTQEEIQAELAWSRSRKAVQARILDAEGIKMHRDPTGSFLESISMQERGTLRDVWQRFPCEAVDTKNYASARIVKSVGGVLPTLTKGQSFLFSPLADAKGRIRWFVMPELFEAMGCPVSKEAQERAGYSCQFSRGLDVGSAPKRSVASLRCQLGNGWHIGAFSANSLFLVWKCQCLGTPMAPIAGARTSAIARGMRSFGRMQHAKSDESAMCSASSYVSNSSGQDEADEGRPGAPGIASTQPGTQPQSQKRGSNSAVGAALMKYRKRLGTP